MVRIRFPPAGESSTNCSGGGGLAASEERARALDTAARARLGEDGGAVWLDRTHPALGNRSPRAAALASIEGFRNAIERSLARTIAVGCARRKRRTICHLRVWIVNIAQSREPKRSSGNSGMVPEPFPQYTAAGRLSVVPKPSPSFVIWPDLEVSGT